MAADDEVLRILGRLEAKVDNLGEDQREDREQSRVSRARIHERMDEFSSSLNTVQGDIRVGAKIDAQVRTELDGLARAIKAHEPAINDMRKLRLGLMLVGGALVASGVTLAAAGEAAAAVVKSWLRIS